MRQNVFELQHAAVFMSVHRCPVYCGCGAKGRRGNELGPRSRQQVPSPWGEKQFEPQSLDVS